MRKRLLILFLLGLFAYPISVRAQEPLKLTTLQVQLRPEYDQPSMLGWSYSGLSCTWRVVSFSGS